MLHYDIWWHTCALSYVEILYFPPRFSVSPYFSKIVKRPFPYPYIQQLENKFCWKHKFWKFFRTLENVELKISKHKNNHSHILTQIFLVNMTLEKPPTTLGENQFESSFLFLENAFYSERNIQQKNQQANFYNLSRFPCLTTASENVQTAKTEQQ